MKQILVALCLFAIFLNKSYAEGEIEISFSNEELATLSPFDTDVQLRVLKDVVKFFKREYDPQIPLPKVRVSESVKASETDIITAVESQGMPAWGLEKGINMYLFDLNVIVLGSEMKIHNLAHELAHYLQWTYRKYPKSEFGADWVEMEAIGIQWNFKPSE